MQHIKYDSQLEIKRDFVADTIKKITGVNVTVEKPFPPNQATGIETN